MFFKLFSVFAVLAVALAAPKPAPQFVAYSSGLDYVYPGLAAASVPGYVSPYASPLAPLTYSAYAPNTVFVR